MIKKLSIIFLFLLLIAPAAFAEEMNDFSPAVTTQEEDLPLSPPRKASKFDLGVETHLLFDKDLQPPDGANIDTLKVKRSNQFYVVPAYNVYKNENTKVDVFANLGEASMDAVRNNKTTLTEETITYDHGFLWAIGARVKQKLWNNFNGHANLKYKEFEADIDEYTFNGVKVNNLAGDTKGRLSEFEAAFLISTTISPEDQETIYKPYAGPAFIWTNYSQGALSYSAFGAARTSSAADADEESSFALIVGVDILKFSDALRINAEAMFFAETALTLSVHYNF